MGPGPRGISPKEVNADFRVRRAFHHQMIASGMDTRQQQLLGVKQGDQQRKKKVSLHAAHPWNPETEGF